MIYHDDSTGYTDDMGCQDCADCGEEVDLDMDDYDWLDFGDVRCAKCRAEREEQ